MRVLVYGDIGGSGGYVRYCRGLFGGRSIPADLDLTFVCGTRFYEQLKPLNERIKVIAHDWPAASSRLRRYLWHLVVYPRIVQQVQPDVEFYPSGQLRVYGRHAITVATCHNLLLFDAVELQRLTAWPESRSFSRYRDRQARSFQAASGLIFLSEYSRRVIRQALPALPRDTVIAHGLENEFRFATPRAYDFKNRITILYVSSIWPYKQHPAVIDAVGRVRQATGKDLTLRLVGGGPVSGVDELHALIRRSGAGDYVEVVGELNNAALLGEYRQTDLFVFASTSETFGITLLEAMGARLPIACSNRTGLPDLLRDGGVYFDPTDPDSIASAMMRLLADESQRRLLAERAFLHAQDYTWERSASLTFDFIRKMSKR